MQDYKNTFVKWLAFFQTKADTRKQIIDSIHPEIKNGFTAIMRIALEEIRGRFEDEEMLNEMEEMLKGLLANSAFGGYMLFCIRNTIDPAKEGLAETETTKGIGNIWIQQQKKDNGKEMMKKIDPFMMMILEKGKQARMNQILASNPDVVQLPYKEVNEIDRFLVWSAVQGYVFAVLESDMIKKGGVIDDIQSGNLDDGANNMEDFGENPLPEA